MEYLQLIERDRDELVRSLQGCIRIPSVRGQACIGAPYGAQVGRCLDYMLELARGMGFSVGRMDGHVGWCEYGRGEEMVAVLGHLDVVPEGEGWTVPPYEGRVAEGRIYGRGAMDDKGPTVAALYALRALKESGVPLKRRIRLIFGVNEETGSADMAYYLSHGGEVPVMGITPDGSYPVINGEKGLVIQSFSRTIRQTGPVRLLELQGGSASNIVPDQAFARLACPRETAEQICAMGAVRVACTRTEEGVRLEARGISAHGASPEEGENAVGRLLLALRSLPLEGELKQTVALLAEKLGMEWNGRALGVAMEDGCSGALTMNLGVIRGTEREVEVVLNYRYPVTHTLEECAPAVRAAFEGAGFHQTGFQHQAPIYMEPESAPVRTLLKVYRDYTGQSAQPQCIGGGTYAKSMPNTLAFGPVFPGDEVREHRPDEFMELDRLMDNAKLLGAAMYELAKDQ